MITRPAFSGCLVPPVVKPPMVVDSYVDLAGASVGDTITEAILDNGTLGLESFSGWGLSTTPLTGITVAAGAKTVARRVTVGGTTYPSNHPLKRIALDHSQIGFKTAFITLMYPIPSQQIITWSGWITFGAPLSNNSNDLYDYLVVGNFSGQYACLQLLAGIGGSYQLNIETGSPTDHSNYVSITPGATYWITLLVDYTANKVAKANIYDETFHQVGDTIIGNLPATGDIWGIRVGQNESTEGVGTSYIEGMLLDYTNHVWPNVP